MGACVERLIRGYQEFRKKRWPQERLNYMRLAKRGQRPEYLLIACSDSRSDPATIFSANPGELFVVRNVAAVVPPYEGEHGFYGTRAAIAYAVLALNVRNIVVMGHAKCGGVAAAMDPKTAESIPFLKEWVDLIKPAVSGLPKKGHHHHSSDEAERSSIKLSLARLREYPFIAERERSGALHIDGVRFDITNGILELLDPEKGTFDPVERRPFLTRLFGSNRARAQAREQALALNPD
jgi:carbonic anhydrase